MKLTTLQKNGGGAIIVGGLLLAAYAICFFMVLPFKTMSTNYIGAVQNPWWIPIALTALVALIALMFGFTAVYTRIYEKAGLVGLVGYVCIEIAYLMQAAKVTWEICLYPVIARNSEYAGLLSQMIIRHDPGVGLFGTFATGTIFIGTTLFSAALFRSAAMPKSAGVMIFLGAVLYGLGPMLSVVVAIAGIIIFALGCMQVGVTMMRSK